MPVKVSNVDREAEGETESETEQIRVASSGSKTTTANSKRPGSQRIHLPAEALN